MDDLKLYTEKDEHLRGTLATVKLLTDNIKMAFGLDKCAEAKFKRGKRTQTSSI